MVRQVVIEAEAPGGSRTMFRLRIDANLIAKGLTAVKAHILVGEILDESRCRSSRDNQEARSPSRS
jgi:hypothetical protein